MTKRTDDDGITLVGGGIMSLTLGVLINEIFPNYPINLIERLGDISLESSSALNNAGTGHAGYCELNYTPHNKNGEINISRAININEMFENSLEFWAYLGSKYKSFNYKKFLKRTPHISFVKGDKNIKFLKSRFESLKKQPLFKEIEFSDDPNIIHQWAPLLNFKDKKKETFAATKVEHGADINFGEVSRQLLNLLKKNKNFHLYTNTNVEKISIQKNGLINLEIKNLINRNISEIRSNKIFIGAGGQSIPLLQKMGLKEASGYAGFPVSGKWLMCDNKAVVRRHNAKVYSQAFDNAPPMSIPHLDLRVINGKQSLLFGPFAGFTFKFLKQGSNLDLPKSVKINNIRSLIVVFLKNLPLLIYLVKQSFMNHASRMKQLRFFYEDAKDSDWKLLDAGKRVQIIKNCPFEGSKLEFGTEVIFSKNKTIAALIGASPGASVSANAMGNVLIGMFGKEIHKDLKKIISSFGSDLNSSAKKVATFRSRIYKQLGLW
jgi:malate dehydrogenase (quinone)